MKVPDVVTGHECSVDVLLFEHTENVADEIETNRGNTESNGIAPEQACLYWDIISSLPHFPKGGIPHPVIFRWLKKFTKIKRSETECEIYWDKEIDWRVCWFEDLLNDPTHDNLTSFLLNFDRVCALFVVIGKRFADHFPERLTILIVELISSEFHINGDSNRWKPFCWSNEYHKLVGLVLTHFVFGLDGFFNGEFSSVAGAYGMSASVVSTIIQFTNHVQLSKPYLEPFDEDIVQEVVICQSILHREVDGSRLDDLFDIMLKDPMKQNGCDAISHRLSLNGIFVILFAEHYNAFRVCIAKLYCSQRNLIFLIFFEFFL